jgi:hypothetical protein
MEYGQLEIKGCAILNHVAINFGRRMAKINSFIDAANA